MPNQVLRLALFSVVAFASPVAARDWTEIRRVGPFDVYADFPLNQVEGMFRDLEHLHTDLARLLGIRPLRERIELYLLRDEATYRTYLRRYLPNVPFRRALYVKTGGSGMVFAYRSEQFATDVRHECTHALLHAAMPMVPLWLDEGLAEYFEMPPDRRPHRDDYLGRIRWAARLGGPTDIDQLESLDGMASMDGGDYRNCWSWVHFMLHGDQRAHHELIAFLGEIQSHSPPGKLSERLDRRVPNLRGAWRAHFHRWR